MKYSKSIFKILIVFLLIAQNSFATSNPIPGIGIVIKKNPGKGYSTVPTGNGGGFSTQLSEGVYELSFPQDQLQKSINGIVKANYPKSSYQYDGSGVEMVLDNSQIKVNSKAMKGNLFAVDKQNNITITVPKGGATLSGKLSWNDAVMSNSISCPDGFIMQNGECVPVNNAGNQQARTEGKTKGKIKDPGPKSPMRTAENPNKSHSPSLNVSLNANGGTSSSTGVDNSLSFNPSLGIAIHWKNFGIGLDAGTFSTKPDFDFNAYAAPLQNLDFLTITNTKSDWTSTYFMLGPQYTIPLSPSQSNESGRHTPFHNKLTFTVALKGGLTINKAPEFSVMDKSTPPKSIASYNAAQDYKTNAFSLKPSIGFDYWINENFALTANAQYLMQTGQKEFTTGYRDLTNVNLAPPISPIQFQENIAAAPKVMTNTKGPENFMSFGFGITYSLRKGWDGSIKGNKTLETASNETQRKGIKEQGLKKNDVETVSDETQRKGIQEQGMPKNELETVSDGPQKIAIKEQGVKKNDVETASDGTQRKGITEKGLPKNEMETTSNETQRKGIQEQGMPKNEMETTSDGPQKIAIKEQGVKKNDVETASDGTQRKGITEGGLPKNETEYVLTDAVVKAIAETLVTMRKGWDGSIKGNIAEKKGIKENGLKKNEAKSENINLVTSTAQTLVNLARKGWDGSIKGNKIENVTNEADVKSIAETLVNIRKGWDGSIKGNKVENVANEADIKMIAEAFVNLRKGWDGSIKGKNIAEKGITENGLKKNDVETSTINGSKAIIENPNDNSGEPGQQVYLFSNGCTRTCTGNWYANSDGSVGCDGTAGPRVCINKAVTTTPSATARVKKRPDMKTQDFDKDGNPTDKKGWDGSIKGNIMETVGPEENGDNIESIHIKITIITKVGFTDCGSPGSFFCIRVEVGALLNDHNLGDLSLEKDQIISKTNVELMNGNIIKVTSVGVKSTISEKTMSEFANKTQKNKEFTLDKIVLDEICKALNLNTPIEPVVFKAENQKYEVINTVNEGKEAQILVIDQKTKIKIDGKEYTLSMLTTSGKGLNSPKN